MAYATTVFAFSITAASASYAIPSFPLRNAANAGVAMPAIGLGTGAYRAAASPAPQVYPECWNSQVGCGPAAAAAVTTWLQMGGPRLDCANSYDNEDALGPAIAASGVPRDSIFVLSKTGPPYPLGYNDTRAQATQILQVLQLDYVDALLIHWPYDTASQGNSTNNATVSSDPYCNMTSPLYNATDCRLSTWRAMLSIWQSGRARAVGVSNYNISDLQEIIDAGLTLPALNQIPFNLYRSSSQDDVRAFCALHGILVNGYSPLGVPDWKAFPAPLAATQLQDSRVTAIAAAHGATPAQVLIAWQYALGIPVNPRTMNATHMAENMAAYSLQLTPADVDVLSSAPQDTCAMDPTYYECAP